MGVTPLRSVLLVGRVNALGGSAKVVQMLQSGLTRRGIRTDVAFPQASRIALQDWCQITHLEAEFPSSLSRAADRTTFRRSYQFFQFLKRHTFDVLNIHFSGITFSALDVLPAALLYRKPVVVSLHTFSPDIRHSQKSRINTKVAARLASKVVVLSEFQRHLVRTLGAPDSKTVVLPNGIDLLDLENRSNGKDYRQGAEFVIGTMCRQEPDKRVPDLAYALAASPSFMRSGRWIVAGDGSLRQANERLCKELLGYRVDFLGHVENHADFYRALDLYALVSDSEAFNLTYLEAAHFGIPSLATSVGGASEFIIPEETGALFSPGEIVPISTWIDRFISNGQCRRSMRSITKARVDQHFNSDVFVSRYLELMEAVVQSNRQ
jgi:glycosyltransferase involved in cell wall biosynthesis